MKALFVSIASILVLMSCNNNGSAERELDSLETRIDTTAEKAWDSLKQETKELKEEVKDVWKNRKDSTESADSAR